jgi:serine/threonine-protein kinase
VGRPSRSVAGLDTPPPGVDEETRATPPEARPDAPTVPAAGATAPTRREPGAGATAATAAVAAPGGAVLPGAGTPAAPPPRRTRLVAALAAVAVLVAAGVVVAVVGLSGGDDGESGGPAATTAGHGSLTVEGVDLDGRPNGVAVARGSAYVTLPRATRLARVPLDDFQNPREGPRVPRGSLDVDAGFGALWVTSASDTERLTRVDLASGRSTTTGLPDGTPVAVDAGTTAVWVGLRGARLRAFPPSRLARIDPRSGRVVRTIDVRRGIQDLAVAADAVWVTNRSSDTVTRVDIRTGEQELIPTDRGPAGVAIGGGAVWVANAEGGTVTRIDRDDVRDTASIGVEGNPRGIAFGGGSAWVPGYTTSTLARIPADRGRPDGDPAELALNPIKATVSRGAVYVVSPAGGELQRVRFTGSRP